MLVRMHSAEKVTSSGSNHTEANTFIIRLKGGDLRLSGSSTKSRGTIKDPGLAILPFCPLSRMDLTLQLSSCLHCCKQTGAALSFTPPDNISIEMARVKQRIQINFEILRSFFSCDDLIYQGKTYFLENLSVFPLMSHWPEVGHRLIGNQPLDKGSRIPRTCPLG